MAKLVFKYATMYSGKSTELLQIDYNYEKQGIKGIILISEKDTRSNGKVVSRLGIEKEAIVFKEDENLYELIEKNYKNVEYILVDESNFLSKEQVDQLGDVVDFLNINVTCYGIFADFRTKLFEGSKRLFEIADDKNEIAVTSLCFCGRKAVVNARIVNGKIVEKGEIVVTPNDKVEYRSICRMHMKLKQYQKPTIPKNSDL